MGDSKRTQYLWFILDESGSMEPTRDDVIGGFNAYLDDRRAEREEIETRVSVVKFDTTVTSLCRDLPIAQVTPLTRRTYHPGGATALYDAVGQTLLSHEGLLGEHTSSGPDAPRVLVIIFTDGEENSSREFSDGQVREMIETRVARGNYTFLYLGADHDAWAASSRLGIAPSNAIGYKKHDTEGTFRALSSVQRRYNSRAEASIEDAFAEMADADGTLRTDGP